MKFTLALSAFLASLASAQNIVEVAQDDENFSTLVDLVIAADLVDTLATTEDITTFAPVNTAFEALPAEVVDNLLTAEWLLHLQDVLGYHVVPALVPASAIIDAGAPVTAEMLNGEEIVAELVDGSVVVNGASTVLAADVPAENGIIHVVDNVLLPSWVNTSIIDRAIAAPMLSTLVELVIAAQLVDTFRNHPGPFTVFAPTDEAFATAVAVVAERLAIDPTEIPVGLITTLLTYHVVRGIFPAGAITEGLELPTVQGDTIAFSLEGGPSVNGAGIVATDILANNGIVHVIDAVLVPPGALPDAADPTEAPDVMDPTEAPAMDPTEAPSSANTVSVVMGIAAGSVAMMALAF